MNSHVDNPFESPVILSLCTGMRGLEGGVERVLGKLRVASFVEIEAFVIENLVQQMEQGVLDPAPVFTNAKTFPYEAFHGKLHWLFGGYPCQPFSHAGLRGGADDPRHLWPFIRRGIKKSRPVGVFFENVEGHITLGLRDVLTDLRKLGYQVEVGLFSAAEVGAPHRRNRVFILGLENAFLIRMRGWSDEQRAHWRRQIQTPRPSELGDAGCFVGQSATERGMDLERNALAERGRNESSNLIETPDGALGNPEYQGSQREIPVRESGVPTKSGLLELSGLADASNEGLSCPRSDTQPQSTVIESGNSGRKEDESGLADADDLGKQQFERIFGEIRERAGNGSEAMENADGGGRISQPLPSSISSERTDNNDFIESSENSGGLADSAIIGVEGDWPEGVGVTEISTGETISGRNSGGDRWPARPGEEQYEWEAPRLESSLGYAVNGYNYREDLLRMAGNAVVPQQSEKAFRTLLLKFIK